MSSSASGSRVTLSEVARAAGVSVMTASYTYSTPSRVSAASREKVLTAAEVLGYPGPDPSARSLRRGTSSALGVVLGESLPYAFDDPQATRFLAGIADVCAGHGMAMTILPTNGSAEDAQRIRAAAVDGFVVWTTTEDDPVLDALAVAGRPVTIHGGPQRSPFGLVGIEDRAAARAVAEAGLRQSRSPAIVSFPFSKARAETLTHGPDPAAATFPVTRNRLLGFQDAITAAGFNWNQIPVAACSTNSAAESARAAERLLNRGDRPDVILTMSDEQARGVIDAAAQAGIPIPSGLAVTGWDGSDTAPGCRLTTIEQDLRGQGAACAEAVIAGNPAVQPQPWRLINGHTTR
ncbi:LacI family DNA-binding transcriptional regulator [Arthrobacter sp. CG_A4]|uniref:LacI family DNA-binding transcriptional regulator n=1 Tax=Arthrobacter sp. CG_A4 TaxID=3071706 RepID=UPI002E0B5F27|nr:DNA-binding LacI/PurR family transcriptional regulator [Arthrobacter sp. CG_A4]